MLSERERYERKERRKEGKIKAEVGKYLIAQAPYLAVIHYVCSMVL